MTDVNETQQTEVQQIDQDNQESEQRSVASLLASVGIKEDINGEPQPSTDESTNEVIKEDKQETPEKETPEERHERRQTQKLARRLKKEQEEFAKKQAEFQANYEKAKLDPVAFLAENGITISDWAAKQMETKDNKALRELERYKKEVQEKEIQMQKLQAEQYHRQLSTVVEQEFKLPTNLEKYRNINVLLQEGIINSEFFSNIAAKIQDEFEETGIKPDLYKEFDSQENELKKLYQVLSKAYNKTGDRPGTEKTISQAGQTLSSKQTQVSSVQTEGRSPEEIKAEIMQKYGIGKSYGVI